MERTLLLLLLPVLASCQLSADVVPGEFTNYATSVFTTFLMVKDDVNVDQVFLINVVKAVLVKHDENEDQYQFALHMRATWDYNCELTLWHHLNEAPWRDKVTSTPVCTKLP